MKSPSAKTDTAGASKENQEAREWKELQKEPERGAVWGNREDLLRFIFLSS